MKRIAVLGSTGSIGRQTLEIVRRFPDRLCVAALAGGRNAALLGQQIAEFGPDLVSCSDPEALVRRPGLRVVSLDEIALEPDIDLVVVATSGKAGLEPTLAAIRSRKQIALANKEVLVMAGGIVMEEAVNSGIEVYPVDSEHSAIWQSLRGEEGNGIRRLILTASGGPFRGRTDEELAVVTPEEALAHPTWQMGPKVTIDSATLMNKGMEIIEAHWLFDVPYERIQVVVHRQSVIHSMVEFVDGSIKAQLSLPDMRLPIQHALTYPERWESDYHSEVDFAWTRSFDFESPDVSRFPCLRLAMEAGAEGGTCPAVLSAADDVGVSLFLEKKIGFTDIARVVEDTLALHERTERPTIEQVLAADEWARETALAVAMS